MAASAAAATGACQTEDGGSAGTAGSSGTAGSTGTGGGAGTGGSAGTGGGGASGGQAGSGNQPPLTSPLGVALLGLGNYASNRLAPALQLTEHCKLRGIVTGTPSKAAMWQEQYGIESENVYSYDTMAGLIDNPNIHVVYIVTPNHVHMQYAIAAARAKKHVWCEKPMAMDVPECQAIIDACRENGVELCIGYRMRHEPNTQTIIGYASSKPYGAVVDVVSHAGFRGFGNAADATAYRLKRAMGGGALYDMGLYAINAARYAIGEEPIRVRNARQWTDRPEIFTEVDEWTEFELEFPSGVIARCRTTFGQNIDSLDVTCESGSYRLSPMYVYTGARGQTSDGTQLNQMLVNQQAKQMDDDALAIIERRAVLAPGEEGLQGVRIILAIQEAASTGQTVDL